MYVCSRLACWRRCPRLGMSRMISSALLSAGYVLHPVYVYIYI